MKKHLKQFLAVVTVLIMVLAAVPTFARGRSKFQQKCLCTDPRPKGVYPWFIPSNKDNSKMYNVKESWES